MTTNRKILILSLIIMALLGVILIIVFTVKIEVIKSEVVIADGNSQIVLVNKKIHRYLQKQTESKTYRIKDVNKMIDVKCFLVFCQMVNNDFSYYCNLTSGSLLPNGIYNTSLNFNQVKIYEYFMYFN